MDDMSMNSVYECSNKDTTASTSEDVSNAVTKPVSVVTSNIPSNATKEDLITRYPCASSESHYIESNSAASVLNTLCVQLVSKSEFVKHKDKKSSENIIIARTEDSANDTSKPRTALFQGREDDEPMAPKDNILEDLLAKDMKGPSFLIFGGFSSNEKYIKKAKKIFTSSGLLSTISFKPSNYIYVGSMKVDIT
jgi:hypothetical protein